jgi:hypothetical protein
MRCQWGGPFAAASYQQQQQLQQQDRSRQLLEQEQQLRQLQLEELLDSSNAGSMSALQLAWQQLEQQQQLAGNGSTAMDRSYSNGTGTSDGMMLSNATEPMFSVDYSFDGACGVGANVTGFEMNNNSCLESMASTASDGDWTAAVASSSSPVAGYDMCHWEGAAAMTAAAAVNMSKSYIYQQQQQQQQFNRSNSGFRNNAAPSNGYSAAAHSMPIAQLQLLQQQQNACHQHSLPLGSPTGGGSLSPKQFAAALASINGSSGSSAANGARSLHSSYTNGSYTNGSSRMSSQASCPLPRPPLSPALQQQLQQQQQLLAQIQQQQHVQQQQLQLQQQQQHALRVLSDELLQLQQLAAKIDAAKAAAAPGSAAAAACEAAALKHTAAVKRALAAKASLQLQMAAAAADAVTSASPAVPPQQQQQQQYELHSVQSVPQLSPQHRHRAVTRSATLSALPSHHRSMSAAAAAAVKPATADSAAAAAAGFHRSASGPLASAAQGKLAQLVKVQKMQAALQDELLQLLPIA